MFITFCFTWPLFFLYRFLHLLGSLFLFSSWFENLSHSCWRTNGRRNGCISIKSHLGLHAPPLRKFIVGCWLVCILKFLWDCSVDQWKAWLVTKRYTHTTYTTLVRWLLWLKVYSIIKTLGCFPRCMPKFTSRIQEQKHKLAISMSRQVLLYVKIPV